MVDPPSQYADDDVLRSQLEARERASREDAAIQGSRRAAAAARLLGLTLPDTTTEPGIEAAPTPALPVEAPTATGSVGTPDPSTDDGGCDPVDPFDPGDPVDQQPPTPSPAVPLPRGGPAPVTTDVHAAAAAAQRSRPEVPTKAEAPLLELRPNTLATEIDRIGDQMVVMTDRVELRDRHGGLRRQLALSDIEDVVVERRLTSAVLHIKSRTATDMVVKGLRPDLAEEAQAAVLALLPEVPLINSIEEKALMHSILALHRAGVLNEAEVAAKTALVARMAGHPPPPER